MRRASLVLFGLLAVGSLDGLAPAAAQQRAAAPAHDPANCYCRSAAGRAPIGAQLCMATPQGWRVAICAMNQNVTSWSPTQQGCGPVSSRRIRRAAT